MTSSILNKLGLFLTLAAALLAVNEAPNELYMKSQVIKYYGRYYNSLRLYLNDGSKTDKTHHDFQISIGRSNVLLGDKNAVDWGITCGKDEEDPSSSCEYKSVAPLQPGSGVYKRS